MQSRIRPTYYQHNSFTGNKTFNIPDELCIDAAFVTLNATPSWWDLGGNGI